MQRQPTSVLGLTLRNPMSRPPRPAMLPPVRNGSCGARRYNKKMKENEAASHMPTQEFELKKLEQHVAMLKEIGQAAWKYPDVYTGFLTQFADKLRIGPMTAGETLTRLGVSVDAKDGAASKA